MQVDDAFASRKLSFRFLLRPLCLVLVPRASMMSQRSGLYRWRYIYSTPIRTLKSTPLSPKYTACGFTQSTVNCSKQRELHAVSQEPQDDYPLFSEHLRPSVLPNALRGPVNGWAAREHWKEAFKNGDGRELTSQEMPIAGRPLVLFNDKRPTAKYVILCPYGIRFYSGNKMGMSLWNVLRWVSWLKRLPLRKRHVLHLLLANLGYIIVSGIIILSNTEPVSISGRPQIRIRSRGSQVDEDASVAQSLEVMELIQTNDEEPKLIPNEDPRVTRFQRIFEGLLSASGFDPAEWKLLCLDMPGQISSIVPISVLPLRFINKY